MMGDGNAVAATAVDWTRLRERSGRRTLALMRWIATTLGRRVARLVLHPITLYFLVVHRTAARASTDYLTRVLGRPARLIDRYRHLHAFAATVLDRVYLLQNRFDAFEITVKGNEHIDAVAEDGGGVVFVGAHMGSFEALRVLGQAQGGLRVAMVMYEDNARQINETLRALAPAADLKVIALGRLESMLELRDWLDGGGCAGLLVDRTLRAPPSMTRSSDARGHLLSLPFLGEPATFSDSAFRLAALLKRPVVYMAGLYLGGNRYELRFFPVADFRQLRRGAAGMAALEAAMIRFVSILESLCREAPMNWFNFYDFWASSVPGAVLPHPVATGSAPPVAPLPAAGATAVVPRAGTAGPSGPSAPPAAAPARLVAVGAAIVRDVHD